MGAWDRVLDFWDREWSGGSYNGRCLREELLARPARDVTSDRNHEEYTVWGVALHVHKYKEMFLAHLENREPSYPYGDDDFPPVPGGVTEPQWLEVIGTMDETHRKLLDRCRTFDEAFLASQFPVWEMPWGDALTWASGHDGYHTAQIRNMAR